MVIEGIRGLPVSRLPLIRSVSVTVKQSGNTTRASKNGTQCFSKDRKRAIEFPRDALMNGVAPLTKHAYISNSY